MGTFQPWGLAFKPGFLAFLRSPLGFLPIDDLELVQNTLPWEISGFPGMLIFSRGHQHFTNVFFRKT